MDTHTLTQLTDEEGPKRGFLMVVLDVHVDHMHRLQRLLLSGAEVCGAGRSGTPPSLRIGLQSHCRFESCRCSSLEKHVYINSGYEGLTFQDLVVDPLFTGYDQVKVVLTVLEPLRSGFDALVAVQHVKDSILGVP